ncbi:helix-turn-helix transcriptional regulator [Nonomuraea aridisoli]|uniref:MmyB-like transcription regulator ligand binding domain-containing protein n=1 Tax=Nonomuraea aridisoli TaxID=2070368 RepID=A0A2W2D1T9_9ACTN|nr:helix-turn-helix transcriptional regulator [Nonomuraea aridisoli]PZG05806.1 hypothetical protein C1J01_43025 [Nonomuraea aridisoli]
MSKVTGPRREEVALLAGVSVPYYVRLEQGRAANVSDEVLGAIDWEDKARETVAFMRLDAGRHPGDKELATLIGELWMRSADFRRLWAEHDVRERSNGVVRVDHPLVGELVLDYQSLKVGDDPDQVLVTYLAEPGSPSDEGLRFLSSWHGDPSGPDPDTVGLDQRL